MKLYEAIFIVHPAIEEDALKKVVTEAQALFEKRGAEMLYQEVMGKKRLAYPIEKQKFGTYVLFQFKSDGTDNVRLNRDLELKDNILAQMVVRIEEDDVREEYKEPEVKAEETVATTVATTDAAVADTTVEEVKPEPEDKVEEDVEATEATEAVEEAVEAADPVEAVEEVEVEAEAEPVAEDAEPTDEEPTPAAEEDE